MTEPSWQTLIGEYEIAFDNEILRTLVGSTVHGLEIAGTDDRDEMGVYIPPPASLLGVGHTTESALARTAKNNERSYHGDVDLMLYSLRKYATLATGGNPSILLPLFVPKEFVLKCSHEGNALRLMAPLFVSQQAGRRFQGYAHAQYDRLTGRGKRNRVPNRPELIEKFGFDTKYAMHSLRLTLQGIELLKTGQLTLPLPAPDRTICRRVREGAESFKAVTLLIEDRLKRLDDLLSHNDLPPEPDIKAINDKLVALHTRYWWDR